MTVRHDDYSHAIDKNEGLAEIDKFHYLHSLLEGSAAMSIQGLALTSANYKKSIEVLKQIFGRPQQIIASHKDELLKVPVCSDDKSTSMRLVYDRINTNIRGLESLGINSEQYGSLLIPVIMSKLPSETRLHIARNALDDVWKIDDLMKTISSEVEAREVSEHVMIKTNNDRKPILLNREQQHHCIVETARIQIVEFKSVAFSVTKPIIPLLVRRKCNGKHHQSICFRLTDGKGDKSKNRESKEGSKKNDEEKRKEQLKNEQNNHDNEPSSSSEKRETLHLNTFENDGFKKQNCEMFSFNLQGKNSEIDIEISALAFPVICSPVTTTIDVQAYPHLDGLQLADNSDIENQSIDMLLRADYYYKIITGEIVNGDNGPIAVASKLGWLLLGPTLDTSSSYALSNLVIDGRKETLLEENEKDELVKSLKRFWDLESLGIVESEKVPESDIVQDITFNGKRYEVGLPWNNDETAPLSNDYELSLNRLLINRLKKDPNPFREYNAIIEKQIKEGIVEHAPENEKEIDNAHFIPHHGVIRNDRDTTKLRKVFDGSAKQEKDGSSLNDHLLNGPNFIPPIFDVLVKFRSYAVGLTADIEKAFLQIEVRKADRDKLRFLWI
ncbi:uncharacterized protein LOC114526512 [Dendronephthya gigantea]|uniref:uncharacterized protein LOC114526512 n=1 Tax=Dendronephthya gigantea TaxID=151771 RepID=UPI00106AB222|nr:uncharacterized protein LOC114526512 [Dendronephthya gigantea]